MTDLISWFDESDFPSDFSIHSPKIASRGKVAVRSVARELPELVLLHGITDCHLAHVEGQRRIRIWMDPFKLVLGQYTQRLTLENDGLSDATGNNLQPDGVLECKYATALNAWRQAGFSTHTFCYDWRKSVMHAADRLGYFLTGLPMVQVGKKVVLICHSMGGLVAAAFAARNPQWNQFVEHCVFIGSPLAGSYNAALAIMGQCDSFQKMDRYSLRESLEDFQRMAASFPGLVDLLPNPEIFPDAEPLFDIANWPGRIAPDSHWLTQSRNLKRTVWESPIFECGTHLVSQGFSTIAKLEWNAADRTCQPCQYSDYGDGSVLNRSSMHPSLKTLKVSGKHGMLCNEREVIDAVQAIAKGQEPQLSRLILEDLVESGSEGAEDSLPRAEAITKPTDRLLDELSNCAVSCDAVTVNRMTSDEFDGFDRRTLRNGGFEWKSLLSLAIASELAYQRDSSVTRRTAKTSWGFEQCMTFDFADTQGFVAWDDQLVLLSYRGSEESLGDWLGNFNLSGVTFPGIGKIHRGFALAFEDALPFVEQILDVASASTKQVWITGHSLGGALATLAGAHYARLLDIAGIVTFGQPKLGQVPLERFYGQHLAGKYLRVVNHRDVVPMIPPNYIHFGKLIHFDRHGNPRKSWEPTVGIKSIRSTDAEDIRPLQNMELDETQFHELQRMLKEGGISDFAAPGQFGAMTMKSSRLLPDIFGFSFADHSITDAYIPTLRSLAAT